MEPLNVLVVGAGTMARVHAREYASLPGARVVGFVDPVVATPPIPGVPLYRALDDVSEAAYDIVDVCAPTPFHRRYVEEGARAKKAILCEKPIARTLEDARAMMTACEGAGVRWTVGHCVRFFPAYVAARDAVRRGDIGEVAVARTFRGGGFPQGWNNWYAARSASGGTLVDLMIHDIDFLRWTLGPVERVRAVSTARERGGLDLSLATLRFRSGTIAHLEASWAHRGFATRFELAGTTGLLAYDSAEAAALTMTTLQPDAPGVAVPASVGRSPYGLELEDFIQALTEDRPFRVTPEDAYDALAVALAAETSANTGRAVTLGMEGGDPE